MLKARSDLLKDDLDLLKQKSSIGCDVEVVHRKLASPKGEINSLVDGLCRDTFDSFASI